MTKILLSGACGSPFPYLSQSLEALGYEVILVDSASEDPRIRKVRRIGEGYFEDVETILGEERPDYYVPLIDEEILWAHKVGAGLGVKIIAPQPDFCRACLNKEDLIQYLRDLRISFIKAWYPYRDDVEYPVIIKPIVGRGSRGVRKIHNAKELEAHCILERRYRGDFMLQEFLEGPEYTVSVTVNNLNQVIAIVPKRVLLKRGITIRAVTERNEAIDAVCRDIVEKMRPGGPFNVQLIMVGGVPKIFEINPRLSTTTVLTAAAGVNEVHECIRCWYRGKDIRTSFGGGATGVSNSYIYFISRKFKEGMNLYRRWESICYE